MRRSRVGLGVGLAALVVGGAFLSPPHVRGSQGDGLESIPLSIRVHVMQSSDSESIACARSDDEVKAFVEAANQYWEQAGVRWEIESVQRTEARPAKGLDRLVNRVVENESAQRSLRKRMQRLLESAMPEDGWYEDSLDLVLVETFGPYGAGYYAGKGRIYLARVGMVEIGVVDEIPPVVLAHELGHALGLKHVSCDETGNFMMGRCETRDRSADKLNKKQIRTARAKAQRISERQRARGAITGS